MRRQCENRSIHFKKLGEGRTTITLFCCYCSDQPVRIMGLLAVHDDELWSVFAYSVPKKPDSFLPIEVVRAFIVRAARGKTRKLDDAGFTRLETPVILLIAESTRLVI